MKHFSIFTLKAEAYVIHRDQINPPLLHDVRQLPWRACVRVGGRLHWEWCRTEADAVAWINSWKKPQESLQNEVATKP